MKTTNRDCSNCKHKDEPWTVWETEPGDVCYDCIVSENMSGWEKE